MNRFVLVLSSFALLLAIVSIPALAAESKTAEEDEPGVPDYNEGVKQMKKSAFDEAHNKLAFSVRKQGKENWDAALEHYSRAIELKPKMADVKAWNKQPECYWRNAPKEVADLLVGWMGPFHEGRDRLQRDEAQRSIGMAMQTLMLAAKAMGYESCPMIGFDIDKVAALVGLPDDHVLGPMVAIGKGTKESWPKPGQLSLDEIVFQDHF